VSPRAQQAAYVVALLALLAALAFGVISEPDTGYGQAERRTQTNKVRTWP
jgi:hypothetical protein